MRGARWLGWAAAFTLTGTIPAYESTPDSCRVRDGVPEDHIIRLDCHDADTGERLSLFDASRIVPGEPFTWLVEVFGRRRVYVIAYDEQDNASCPSDTVEVDGGEQPVVGVAPMPSPVRELFDLVGRRVQRPVRSGIYFERITTADGRRTSRVVILR